MMSKRKKDEPKQPIAQKDSYIARKRHKMALEMKQKHPFAFLLLDEIAVRARRTAGTFTTKRNFTYHLEAGEALVPTYTEMGWDRGVHRHALEVLQTVYGQIETFRIGEGRGLRTVARLVKDDIFEINIDIGEKLESIKARVEKAAKKVFKKAENATSTATSTGLFIGNENSGLAGQLSNHNQHNDHPNNNDLTNVLFYRKEPKGGGADAPLCLSESVEPDHGESKQIESENIPADAVKAVEGENIPAMEYDILSMEQLLLMATQGDYMAGEIWTKRAQLIPA